MLWHKKSCSILKHRWEYKRLIQRISFNTRLCHWTHPASDLQLRASRVRMAQKNAPVGRISGLVRNKSETREICRESCASSSQIWSFRPCQSKETWFCYAEDWIREGAFAVKYWSHWFIKATIISKSIFHSCCEWFTLAPPVRSWQCIFPLSNNLRDTSIQFWLVGLLNNGSSNSICPSNSPHFVHDPHSHSYTDAPWLLTQLNQLLK